MNKYDKLIDAISDLDADLIEEHLKMQADMNRINVINKDSKETKVRRIITNEWRKWVLAAACLCLAVIMVAALLPKLWADPTPPTPSGSDIFYNENGELDEKLIFENLSQVIWDTGVTSPEEEKPLGKIYEWNGLRLEEELYNKLITAGENDLFAVRVIYDGKKLYENNNDFYQRMIAAQTVLDQLKAEAEKLEKFKLEAEAFVSITPTDDEMKAFYYKCVEKYNVVFTDRYITDGKYDAEKLENALSVLYNVNIPNQKNRVSEYKIQADERVLHISEGIFRRGNVLTAYQIKNYLVMFASENILDDFSKRIDTIFGSNSDFVSKDEYVFTLSPKYLADELDSIVNPKHENDELSPDPNEKTKFVFTKLKFYSTNEELKTNIKVIEEINKCYDHYDDLTFTVSYSGNLPKEKIEAMKYSEIEQSKDGSAVTITVNYENFNVEAMKSLSCDKNVWRIFVSFPQNAEMGFGKNKMYFGWPAVTDADYRLINDREKIMYNLNYIINYNHVQQNHIRVSISVEGNSKENEDYIFLTYGLKNLSFSMPQENFDIELLKEISRDPVVTKIKIRMQGYLGVSYSESLDP